MIALFLKNLLFTLLLPGSIAVYLPLQIVRDRSPVQGAALVVGSLLLLFGAAVYLWCVWDFATTGRGTPAPIDAPKKLVVRGLYCYTRNPMYVGVLAAILGWVVLYSSASLLIYALVVATAFHLFVVFYEEPHLKRLFGPDYEGYTARVGRWLPRPRRVG